MSAISDELKFVLAGATKVLGPHHTACRALVRAIETGKRADVNVAWQWLRSLPRRDHRAIIDEARRAAGIEVTI